MILCEGGEYRAGILEWEDFERFWPDISDMMDRVPQTWATLTKESVCARTKSGSLQVWGIGCGNEVKMIIFSQIACFDAYKALQVIWGAGEGGIERPSLDVLDEGLKFFAKTQLCRKIDIIGRAGWERILADRGFKRSSITLSREVDYAEGKQ